MKANNRDSYIGFRVSKEEKDAIERARKEFNLDVSFSDFLRMATSEFLERLNQNEIQNPIMEKIKLLLGEMNKVIKIEEKITIKNLIKKISES